jgi:transposase
VLVVLTVRRLFCVEPGCGRRTFAEQVDGLTVRHGRHTGLAGQLLQTVALACGGRPGARLSDRLAVPASRSTLLRVIRRIPDPPMVTPKVLGVDDFAKRRGHSYATILVDMVTRRPVEVLPDRDGETLAAWLREHPGVEVICRDRSGAYADGAARGAPDAIQIADRWHLMHNLSDAVHNVVTRHRRCLNPAPAPPPEQLDVAAPSVRTGRRAVNTRARHAAVHALLGDGVALNAIARRLQMARGTVRRYARAASADDLIGPNRAGRPGVLAAFKPYLQARSGEGVTDAHMLFAEIRSRGYRGTLRTLQRFLVQVRRNEHTPPPSPVPPARHITAWIMRPDHKLSDDDRVALKRARSQCADLAALADLADGFNTLARNLTGDRLQEWIHKATAGPFSEIRAFATGLLADYDAVVAGLTQPWSSGPVEGHVNRIKTIKRQMYGRANLDLLRKRVLTPP